MATITEGDRGPDAFFSRRAPNADYLSLTAILNGFLTKRGTVGYAGSAMPRVPGVDGDTLRAAMEVSRE